MSVAASRLDKLMVLQQSDPKDPELMYMIALELSKATQHAEAVKWLDQALSLNIKFYYAYYQKGKSLAAVGDLSAARAALLAGLTHAKKDKETKAAGELASLLSDLKSA